jgi:NADH-quinone oxidoreductase subunit L
MTIEQLIWLVPLLPFLGFVINGLGRNSLSKGLVGIIGSGVILASFIISVVIFFSLQGDTQKSHEVFLFDWISAGTLHIPLSFLVDPLSSIMLLIITGIGFLIHLYSTSYMHNDAGFGKFFRLSEPVCILHAFIGIGIKLHRHVYRLGRRGFMLLPVNRFLVYEQCLCFSS